MQAEIITIGDEILIGQIVDTNSTFICQELNKIGIEVHQVTSIHDDRQHILKALNEAANRVPLILITGGLGPTKDDITKSCFLEFFQDELMLHRPTREHVEHLFATYIQKAPSDQNLNQALVPSRAKVLHNLHGTAPGLWMENDQAVFIAMPGVPFEMKYLMRQEIIPRLTDHFDRPHIYHKTLMTYGMGESSIADRIGSWADQLPDWVKLAYLPSYGKVRLRLSASHKDQSVLRETIDGLMEALSAMLSDIAVGYEGLTTMVAQIGDLLIERGQSMGVVESCTGGAIAREITQVAGVSKFFRGGIIPYATELKTKLLQVNQAAIDKHSTVSPEIALSLAESGRVTLGADFIVATTGIAGPSKGEGSGAVGRVCIAVAGPKGTYVEEFHFGKARERIIQKTVDKALELLLKEISKN
jgi:nicotinamide-nucleotide amidase